MSEGFRDILRRQVCSRQVNLAIGIGIFGILTVLMLVSERVAEPGSATYVVTVMNIAGMVFFMLVCAVLLVWCNLD